MARRGERVRRRHRRRHGRARAPGAGGRRGARRRGHDAVDPLRRVRTRDRDPAAARDPFPHTFFDVVGFQRSLSRRNLGFVPKMWRARRGDRLLRRLRRRSSCSVGGYASMPAVFAARRLGSRSSSSSTTCARAGQPLAAAAAALRGRVPELAAARRDADRRPGRQAILDVDRGRDRARPRRARPAADRFVVAVMGGSQGSGVLNDAVADSSRARATTRLAIGRWRERFRRAELERRRAAACHQPIGYEPTCRSCTPPPTCSSGGAARAPCTRSPSPGPGDPRAVGRRGRGPPDAATSRGCPSAVPRPARRVRDRPARRRSNGCAATTRRRDASQARRRWASAPIGRIGRN